MGGGGVNGWIGRKIWYVDTYRHTDIQIYKNPSIPPSIHTYTYPSLPPPQGHERERARPAKGGGEVVG